MSYRPLSETGGYVPTADLTSAEPSALGGGLVVSLDFELAWGVHDSLGSDGHYRQHLLGARDVVPRLLDLFAEFDIQATWATVGFLFAGSLEELLHFSPALKPSYTDKRRDPYRVVLGENEGADPLHFAQSLVKLIGSAPGQEIASHTFSHYYAFEDGQTREQFEADLLAARRIALSLGHTVTSLVMPRHQNKPEYLPTIAAAGFTTYRSNEANLLNRPALANSKSPILRAARLLDSYLPLTANPTFPWKSTVPAAHGLVDVRESRFLRPVNARLGALEGLRFERLTRAMRYAAHHGELFHAWWHPHNFGAQPSENLKQLRRLLELRADLWERNGFASYSMRQVDELVRTAVQGASLGERSVGLKAQEAAPSSGDHVGSRRSSVGS